MFSRKKRGKIEIDTAIGFIMALVFIVLVVGFIVILKTFFITNLGAEQTVCWLSNNIKSGGALFGFIPNYCSMQTVEDVDQAKLASLLRATWWMYLQGEENFGNAADEIFPVYVIVPKEDISLEEFFKYILTHNSNKPDKEVDVQYSDFAYLEQNTEGQTICFDKSNDESLKNLYLEKGKQYYIIYYDDQFPLSTGDRILISPDPDFDATSWASKLMNIGQGITVGSIIRTGSGLGTVVGGIVGFTMNSYSESECILYTHDLLGSVK